MMLDISYINKVNELKKILRSKGISEQKCQEIAYKLNQMVEEAMNAPL